MTVAYLGALSALQRVKQFPQPKRLGAADYEAERGAAEKTVRASAATMVRVRKNILALAKQHQTEVNAIRADKDLKDEAKQRRIAAAAEDFGAKLNLVVDDFEQQDQQLRAKFATIPPSLAQNPVEAARVSAFGAIAVHLTPPSFLEMFERAVASRDRALLSVMIPTGESFVDWKNHYKPFEMKIAELARVGRLALETEATHAMAASEDLSRRLRTDLIYLLDGVMKGEALDMYERPEVAPSFVELEATQE